MTDLPANPPASKTTSWPAPALPRGRIFPAQLALAAELLERITDEALPADRSLQRELAARRRMGRRDRERVRELVLFVLRQRRLIDWLLESDDPPMAARVGIAIALADRIDPVLAETAGLTPDRLEHVSSAMARSVDDLPAPVRFNLSTEAETRWQRLDPPEPEALAHALDGRAPVDLHLNPRHQDRPALQQELAGAGIDARPIPGLPQALRLERPARLTRLDAFLAGGFEIQDAGSQWVVRATGARPDERVLDLCAGAGGKTLGMLDETRGRLAVTACDLHAERLERLAARAARHGDRDLDLRALDASAPLPADMGRFDRVLIDAPCSGSGTWRRHPELRWARIDWPELARTQRALIENGARATRPRGLLVYATCSLWREENEDIVEAFLSDHPDWHPESPAIDDLPDDAIEQAMIRLRPDRHGCDGFFIACLRAPD
ncbi:RsmB/NOP family class I SAM-dependent RNA methyltransferase [Guyparkeria sp.]|uniref:RsmB/NOP family class I SAM-dependent RNA methyltransferase n=1 Tax=Guyparkeria sp. TaxID=2035736 RepID=UPI003970E175